jgi:hypothetical protein
MIRLATTLILAIVLVLPHPALAWGKLGHRVVGGIADSHLTAKARAALKKLLGNESLAMAASWADFIKSDRAYDYLGPWHYINLPKGLTEKEVYAYLERDTATDVYTRLNFVIKQLKDKKLPREKQVFYLKLLLHLVGDLHQPMHAGRAGDRGGNGIRVYWFNNSTNLHRLWDEQLIEYQQLSYTEHVAAINFATPGQVKKWQQQPIQRWIFESYQLAEKLYDEAAANNRLGYAYDYRHITKLNEQLLRAGIRLAGVLNTIYGA